MRQIMVFGSNRQGRHGKGAALYARLHHGAVYGQAEGLQGDSYAIITKELRPDHPPVTLEEVKQGVDRLLGFAAANPDMEFMVTAIGTGLAGFKISEIAPMFINELPNVRLNTAFLRELAIQRGDQYIHI